MAISLQKGQRISLSKEAPGLTKIMCGLGWDIAKQSGGGFFSTFGKTSQDYDLDAAVICLNEYGKIRDVAEFMNCPYSRFHTSIQQRLLSFLRIPALLALRPIDFKDS